jgi:VWFA-related protein
VPRQPTAVAWLTLVAAPVVSFSQAPQQPPVFRSRVDLVQLDVSVLDKDRRPVRGLTAADFTILEDGKPQTITAFWAVDVPEPPVPATPWIRDVAPDVKTNEVARTPDARLIVILIDDALLPHGAASIESAKKIARGVIDRASASDQVAVVFSKASGSAQDFTNDRTRLLAAVDTLAMGHASYFLGWDTARPAGAPASLVTSDTPGPVTDNDAGLRQDSMRTLRMVADTLIAAPHRRKVLMFVQCRHLGRPCERRAALAGGPGVPHGHEGSQSAVARRDA